MTHRSIRIASLLATVTLSFAAGASAQARGTNVVAEPLVFGSDATYEVTFSDDPLAALPNGVIVPIIRVRGGVGSPRLMRARTQFVVEMLKSVESI